MLGADVVVANLDNSLLVDWKENRVVVEATITTIKEGPILVVEDAVVVVVTATERNSKQAVTCLVCHHPVNLDLHVVGWIFND